MKKILIILVLALLFSQLFGCINRTPYEGNGGDGKIILSVFMTKDEIIEKLGDDYEFTTVEEGHTKYHSTLKYEGITFHYHYEEEVMNENLLPESIVLESNSYTYNFEFKLDDNALKILRHLGTKFDEYYDSNKQGYAIDVFEYREKTELGSVKDTKYLLKVMYDDNQYYESKEEISEDTKIVGIIIFVPL